MTWTIRIMQSMVAEIRADLRRPHPFAWERVGFVLANLGNQGGTELIVLPTNYLPVPDDEYLEDQDVGAKVGAAAIRRVMQAILGKSTAALHVHMHEGKGRPWFSKVDMANYPALVASFQNAAPAAAHGALLLSEDSCDALVWMPGAQRPQPGGRVVLVGRPIQFFPGGGLYA